MVSPPPVLEVGSFLYTEGLKTCFENMGRRLLADDPTGEGDFSLDKKGA
jgi:hypothetical protein